MKSNIQLQNIGHRRGFVLLCLIVFKIKNMIKIGLWGRYKMPVLSGFILLFSLM